MQKKEQIPASFKLVSILTVLTTSLLAPLISSAGVFITWEEITEANPNETAQPIIRPQSSANIEEEHNYANPDVAIVIDNSGNPNYVESAIRNTEDDISEEEHAQQLQESSVVQSPPDEPPPLHFVDVSVGNGDLLWFINGAPYTTVTLTVANEKGLLQQSYSQFDELSLNAKDAELPDGTYSFLIIVRDPEFDDLQSVANEEVDSKECIEVVHEYDGVECYYLESPEDGLVNSIFNLNGDIYQNTSERGEIVVKNSKIELVLGSEQDAN